jgi:hypothetical protein
VGAEGAAHDVHDTRLQMRMHSRLLAKAAFKVHDRARGQIEVLPQDQAPKHLVKRVAANSRPEQRALDSVPSASSEQIVPTPCGFPFLGKTRFSNPWLSR